MLILSSWTTDAFTLIIEIETNLKPIYINVHDDTATQYR